MNDLLKKFYEGKTTSQEEEVLFNASHDNGIDQEILQAQKEYFTSFRNMDTDQFESMFQKQISKKQVLWSFPVRIAASLLIGAIVYAAGYLSYQVINKTVEQISKLEMELMQSRLTLIEETLSKGNNHSTRKGLAMVSQMNYMDDRIAEELLLILSTSENINLRLMALEQLSRHINSQTISEKIFNSISAQDSELVLAELARIAIIVKNKDAADQILDRIETLHKENAMESFPLRKELKVLLDAKKS